ncbi:30S ribosomal protein S4 [Planosporangium sp. 12N6]|uniref:30S ribosomal protein S4 n=1 Tax=Planosporangium spinosum TaxID=3402278 RepID=UPI003CEBECA2
MPTRPKVRLSRALGIPLTPKSTRYFYFERRPYPPGVHVRERHLRRVVDEAFHSPGRTGETLIELLERRLDAVVLRAGFARTIYQARQLVSHGHFEVDGQRVDVPSYRVRPGQTVRAREAARDKPPLVLAAAGANAPAGPVPPYLDVRLPELTATLIREPKRSEVPVICNEQLVVEYYAR